MWCIGKALRLDLKSQPANAPAGGDTMILRVRISLRQWRIHCQSMTFNLRCFVVDWLDMKPTEICRWNHVITKLLTRDDWRIYEITIIAFLFGNCYTPSPLDSSYSWLLATPEICWDVCLRFLLPINFLESQHTTDVWRSQLVWSGTSSCFQIRLKVSIVFSLLVEYWFSAQAAKLSRSDYLSGIWAW